MLEELMDYQCSYRLILHILRLFLWIYSYLFLSISIYLYIYISIYIHISIYIYEAGNHQGKYDHLSMDEKSEASFAS